jgi:hypothetical protein
VSLASSTEAPGHARSSWHFLLSSRWLCWHAFAVVATLGMLWLGDWQLHRAEAGNELSWAYTFEWPLFAIFVLGFWAKSLKDELHLRTHGAEADTGGEAGRQPDAGSAGPGGDDRPDLDEAARAAHLALLTAEVRRYRQGHGWR